MNQLDVVYHDQRLAMVDKVATAAVGLWTARDWGADESAFSDQVLPLIDGGIAATVQLVNAYMQQKARIAASDPVLSIDGLDASLYSVSSMRGADASEVYQRPFGTLGYHLARGADFASADIAAGDHVRKLAETDMQMAMTTSSVDWMTTYG